MKQEVTAKKPLKLLYLSKAQVMSLGVTPTEITECVEKSFLLKGEGKIELPPKWGLFPKDTAFIHAMPAAVKSDVNIAGLKWVSGYGDNQAKGLPFISGVLVLNDLDTGIPLSVMDCTWLTDQRTAGAGMVAIRRMAPEGSTTMALIGVGKIGTQYFETAYEVLPHITTFYLYDPFPASLEAFMKRIEKLPGEKKKIIVAKSTEEAVKNADIIVTALPMSSEPKPMIKKEWLKENVLLCPQDYDCAFIPDCITTADEFILDDTEQYIFTKKMGHHFKGYPDPNADMGEVLAGKYKLKPKAKRRVALFQGIAAHDMVVAKFLYEKAIAKGVGTLLDL